MYWCSYTQAGCIQSFQNRYQAKEHESECPFGRRMLEYSELDLHFGLINLDNNFHCFLNSVLQSMWHLKTVRHYIDEFGRSKTQ